MAGIPNIFSSLVGIFKGANVWQTAGNALQIGGTLVVNSDSNSTGEDDLIGNIMISAADGLNAYGKKDYNKLGNLIDAVISGLQSLKASLVSSGKIQPSNK
jgi:hypothetical protein